jgi:hypothetical protein
VPHLQDSRSCFNTMSLLTYSSMHWWPKAHLLSMLPRLHHGGSLTMVLLTMLSPTWATSRCIYHILNLMILSSEMAPSLTLIQPLSKPPLYLKMVSVSLACKRMISISQSYTSNNFSVYFLPSTFLVKKFLMRTGHHFIIPNSAIHSKNTPNLVNFIQKWNMLPLSFSSKIMSNVVPLMCLSKINLIVLLLSLFPRLRLVSYNFKIKIWPVSQAPY